MIDIESIKISGNDYVLEREVLVRTPLTVITPEEQENPTYAEIKTKQHFYTAYFDDKTNINLLVYNGEDAHVKEGEVIECISLLASKHPEFFSFKNSVISIIDTWEDGRKIIVAVYKDAYRPDVYEFKSLEGWYDEIISNVPVFKELELI